MKKLAKSLLCLTLALTLIFSFTACGKKDRSEEAIQLVKDMGELHSDFKFEDASAFCVDPDAYMEYAEDTFEDMLKMADMDVEDVEGVDDLKDAMIEFYVAQGMAEEYAKVIIDITFDTQADFESSEYSVEKDGDKYIVTYETETYDGDSFEDVMTDAVNTAEQYAAENGITSASDPAFIKIFEDVAEDAIDDLDKKTLKRKFVVIEVDGELKIDWDECDLDD